MDVEVNDVQAKPWRFAPVGHTYLQGEMCGVDIREEYRNQSDLDRIALMLATALPGVRVERVLVDQRFQLSVEQGRYHSSLMHLSPAVLNEHLGRLAGLDVVGDVARHPWSPSVWLLMFRGIVLGSDHERALRKIHGIEHAVVSRESVYGEKAAELYVPTMGAAASGDDDQHREVLLTDIRRVFNFKFTEPVPDPESDGDVLDGQVPVLAEMTLAPPVPIIGDGQPEPGPQES